MHYLKLIKAHHFFYDLEPRAHFYDDYMHEKNEEKWKSGNAPLIEVEKLFRFVREWEYHFQGNPTVFKRIYDGNYQVIKSLSKETIEDIDLANSVLRMKIRYIFDRIADCAGIRRYESTDTSTILHTILPKLFIIWDNTIKKSVKVQSRGANYSGVFLLKMQKELNQAIKTCMRENRLTRVSSITFIEKECGNKTLAKLADEYNYMKYSKKHSEFT